MPIYRLEPIDPTDSIWNGEGIKEAVLIEAAAGHHDDVAAAITDLREALTIVAGLARVVFGSD